jgi:hypothetical protein
MVDYVNIHFHLCIPFSSLPSGFCCALTTEIAKPFLCLVDLQGGRAPLFFAAWSDRLKMAALLLQHGADVNAQSQVQPSALKDDTGNMLWTRLRLISLSQAEKFQWTI